MPDNVYDAVRYSNDPYAQTHPERLATVAILHGLEPPDPFHARVLEIGCGAGGNLMAMAAATPGIRAPGVDLAAEPIAEGRARDRRDRADQRRAAPGRLRDLADGSLGEFDYIVAHGVYGWVPGGRARRAAGDDRASLAPRRRRLRLLQRPARRLLPAHAARRRALARARASTGDELARRRARRRSSTSSSPSTG